MADLKTDYKDDVLDTSVNSKRTFNIVDQDGNIIFENVTLNDTTVYSQIGDSFGALDINSTNEAIEQVSSNLETHTHDGRYYTETEIDKKFNQVNSDLDGRVINKSAGINAIGLKWNANYTLEAWIDAVNLGALALKSDVDKKFNKNLFTVNSDVNEIISNVNTNGLSVIRTNNNVQNMHCFGSGIAFANNDTYGYLNFAYNTPAIYVGGGNNAGTGLWRDSLVLQSDRKYKENYYDSADTVIPSKSNTVLSGVVLNLEQGVWIVSAYIQWASNANGKRRVSIYDYTIPDNICCNTCDAPDGTCEQNVTWIIPTGGTQAFAPAVYQTSGEALILNYVWFRAIKVG